MYVVQVYMCVSLCVLEPYMCGMHSMGSQPNFSLKKDYLACYNCIVFGMTKCLKLGVTLFQGS